MMLSMEMPMTGGHASLWHVGPMLPGRPWSSGAGPEVLPQVLPSEGDAEAQLGEPRLAAKVPTRKRLAKRGVAQQPAPPDLDDMLVDLEDY